MSVSASPVIGSCFPSSGTVTISSPILWENLSCSHLGDIAITGGGSFTLISSNFTQSGLIALNDTTSFDMIASTLIGGNISLANSASFFSNDSSTVDPYVMKATNVASVSMYSTVADFQNGSRINISGNSLSVYDSNLVISNSSSSVVLGGNTTVFSGSTILANSTNTQLLRLTGLINLAILNSTVTDEVSSSSIASSDLIINGGIVNLTKSEITSSDGAIFGFSPISQSQLNILGNTSVSIDQSQLIVGSSNSPRFYNSSTLSITSNGALSVSGSVLQSESQTFSSVLLGAQTPAITPHQVTLNNSLIQMDSSPGNVTLISNFGFTLNQSQIFANASSLTVRSYQFTAISSDITTSNSVSGLVGVAKLFNVTLTASLSKIASSYSQYAYVLAHVFSNSSTAQPISNAVVSLISPSTGITVYSATTNASGWAMLTPLTFGKNQSGTFVDLTYVGQASSGGTYSSQENVTALSTTTLDFTIPSAGKWVFPLQSYPVPGGLGPLLYVEILSNSYPVFFRLNSSNAELNFNTVGSAGYSFYFNILYPKNLSMVPLTATVDGLPVSVKVGTWNSTYETAIFNIPSGDHAVALDYIQPNGNYLFQQYPAIYPTPELVATVILIALVGCLFCVLFLRRKASTT